MSTTAAAPPQDRDAADRRRAYWRQTRALTLALLAAWFLVTFVPAWWAKDLNRLSVFGWPLAFYIGAQGALIAYLAIIWIYAHVMDRIDRRYGVAEDEVPVIADDGDGEDDDA